MVIFYRPVTIVRTLTRHSHTLQNNCMKRTINRMKDSTFKRPYIIRYYMSSESKVKDNYIFGLVHNKNIVKDTSFISGWYWSTTKYWPSHFNKQGHYFKLESERGKHMFYIYKKILSQLYSKYGLWKRKPFNKINTVSVIWSLPKFTCWQKFTIYIWIKYCQF